MADRDIFDLELSPGEQPPSGVADRALVVIAGLALLAGIAIAVINAVPHDQTAQASPSPSATPTATPVPFPTRAPPRVATIAAPDVEIVLPSQQPTWSGWIRATQDLVLRLTPEPKGAEITVLPKGTAAYADQQGEPATEPGWLFLQDPQGWIASISGGQPLVRRYEWPHVRSSGSVNSLLAGDHGVLAMVTRPNDGTVYLPAAPMVSGDGATWRAGDSPAFGGWEAEGIAWGPAGWLAVSEVSDSNGNQRVWVWNSTDGMHWIRLGMMAGVTTDYPTQLAGSDRGYVLITNDQSGFRSQSGSPWYSADGRTWTESNDPVLRNLNNVDLRLKGVTNGFYLWDANAGPMTGPRFAAFSADGVSWRPVTGGRDGVTFQLTTIGSQTTGIDEDPTTLVPRVWSATIARGQLIWTRRPSEEAAFAGGVVTQLVNDGTRMYAFGWDRATDAALVWTSDGASWTRTALPASFGGIPTMAAGWPGGVVVVGHRPTLRGDNPVFWHRTPGGGWLPEPSPAIAAVPDPGTDSCPALPRDYLEVIMADVPALLVCHGATPISFRAWSARCDGCSGGTSGIAQPAWLLQPTDNQLFLNPAKTTDGGWWGSAVVSPTVPLDNTWLGAWVELTGHYDDPAAATCHRQPSGDELQWWSGQQTLIAQCRQAFVVTDVKVVSDP